MKSVKTRLSTVSIASNLTGIRIFAAHKTVTVRIRRFGTDSMVWDGFHGLGRIPAPPIGLVDEPVVLWTIPGHYWLLSVAAAVYHLC